MSEDSGTKSSSSTLRTVRVPAEFEAVFAKAEETVSRFFGSRHDDPAHGTIEIFGERYILVRAASLSVEFFGLVGQLFGEGHETEADRFARNILFDLAHALGRSDARNFHRKMNLVDPIAKLSAGPVHFSHAGWAFVDIFPQSNPVPTDDFYLIFDHPYSFESDAWLRAGRSRDFPVCIMNAGWSSGWCEESFGIELVSSEVLCRAKGDETCRFIMAPPARIEEHVRQYVASRSTGSVGNAHEIPDFFARKRAEEELRRLYDRLKELDTLKTQFFANVSHELRTPLALILGPLEKWQGAAQVPAELRKDLDLIGRNARTLLRHVSDILDVSKLEAGKMSADYSGTDLARLVRQLAANFDGLAGERRIAYRVETPDRLAAEADPGKIERVVLNLLSNAFKFTPAGGKIRVHLEARDGHGRLTVGDSGPGVPEALREAIFERFRQGEGGPTRRFGGTGLGLAIARDFVTLHGGTIVAGAAEEGGALLTVTLPLRAAAGVPVRPEAPPAQPHVSDSLSRQLLEELGPRAEAPLPEAGQGRRRARILVVEDNEDMGRFLVDSLATDHDCFRAVDGEDGLRKARELAPDLIISDVMMPRSSGDEMLRALRKTPGLEDVPVIMLTARAEEPLRVTLLREGAQDYLVKPFSLEELRSRAGNLLAMKRARDVLQRELATRHRDVEQLATDLAARKRELQAALETARVAREDAERAATVKSDFLDMVSHELKTPIATILMQLDALGRLPQDGLSPRHKAAFGRLSTSGARLSQMVTQLLDFSRLEDGKLPIAQVPVNLHELAGAIIEDLESQATAKGIAVRLEGEPGSSIASDPRLLRIALTNLVENAIKFTNQGEVVVRVSADAREARLVVADTGIGIPEDKLTIIFEPFEQLEPTYSKSAPGVGLGLSIVRKILDALGGSVSVRSTPGEGSTFTISLPSRPSSERRESMPA